MEKEKNEKKFIISTLIILIIIGVVIGIVVITNGKDMEEKDLFSEDKITYIEIQHKNESIKIMNPEDIDNIFSLFKNNLKSEKSLEEEKGWIYRISSFDENDKCINNIYILGDNSISVDGKRYRCDGQIISTIDEISGIER